MDLVESFGDGVVEAVEVGGNEVGEFRVFGVAPKRLDRIEIGCVGRQPYDVELPRAALVQLTDGQAMDVQAIHHDDERSPVLATKSAKIADDVRRPDVPLLDREVLSNLPAAR